MSFTFLLVNYESGSETYEELKSVRSPIKPNWIPNDGKI